MGAETSPMHVTGPNKLFVASRQSRKLRQSDVIESIWLHTDGC